MRIGQGGKDRLYLPGTHENRRTFCTRANHRRSIDLSHGLEVL